MSAAGNSKAERRPRAMVGILLMLAASTSFSLMSALVKGLSAHLPTAELVLLRCMLPLPFLAWQAHRSAGRLLTRHPRLMLLRCLAGALAMGSSFWSLGRLPLADSILIGKSKPVLIALLAPLLIGERPGRGTLLCLLLSMAGLVLVVQPTFELGNLAGLVAVFAALASALAHLAVRRLSAHDPPAVVVLNFTVFVTLLAGVATFPVAVVPAAEHLLALVALAVCATAGQLFMTAAYAADEAPAVSAASYTTIAFGLLLGWWLWDERLSLGGWAGASMLVVGGAILIHSRWSQTGGRYREPAVEEEQER